MMTSKVNYWLALGLLLTLMQSCIGTDVVDDFVEPRVSLLNKIDVMLVGDQHLFEAAYFNNTGLRESARFEWSSSDLDVTQINENGTAFALGAGETTISYTANGITDSFLLTVLDPTLVNEDSIRMMQEESQEGDSSGGIGNGEFLCTDRNCDFKK